MRAIDLLHPLHPDLEIQGIRSKEGAADHGQAPCRGGHSRPGRLQGQSVVAKAPYKGVAGFCQGQPVGAEAAHGHSH
ncbi:hypothetical protein B296_00050288 [Ensete ventricosum]|uniref:Uncharacterized protein n=1 Tax=Ensete ventricosum TaxID=4639 RepID=A0A426XAU3_ENSVE|nr:hypothetical protein B296_00050288 [Ensete ventricosum]